jgi:hypothetical protein
VYAADSWHDSVRKIDGRTLHVVRALELRLPFEVAPDDRKFVPIAVAVGGGSVWIATDRGAISRAHLRLGRTSATLRMPLEALGAMAVGASGVWLAESGAGAYRVDLRTNHVSRIALGPSRALDAEAVGLWRERRGRRG